MSNFIYHKKQIPVNLDQVVELRMFNNNRHHQYQIEFEPAYSETIIWEFDTAKERNAVYEEIKLLYVQEINIEG